MGILLGLVNIEIGLTSRCNANYIWQLTRTNNLGFAILLGMYTYFKIINKIKGRL